MTTTRRNQKLWANALAPHLPFKPEEGSWRTLQSHVTPLIKAYGSSAHHRGMVLLGLDQDRMPEFNKFRLLAFEKTGWRLEPYSREIEARHFFGLLEQKIFPCVQSLRPVDEVFCASRPDFWHEAVGHIAPLVDPEVSWFYQSCGRLFTATPSLDLEKILWVLLEYGFLREGEATRAFGAALTGSFMALQRWRRGRLVAHPFAARGVLRSGLYDEHRRPRRDVRGRIIFYEMESLAKTLYLLTETNGSTLPLADRGAAVGLGYTF